MKPASICTYTGRTFYILAPRPKDVCIEDIAHALSLLCRFTGHTREFYSVAQHSVMVSRVCDPLEALAGLLHDGSEAYLADLNSPLKHSLQMAPYRTAEKNVEKAVRKHFGLPKQSPSVKPADQRLLITEKRDLLTLSPAWVNYADVIPLPEVIVPWTPKRAEREFLRRFQELTRL